MDFLKSIIDFFSVELPADCHGVVSKIEYYTYEPGFKLQGDCIDADGRFIRYMNYRDGISWDLAEILDPWNAATLNTAERWNKAEFTIHKDSRSNVKLWWDEEFQRSLYNDG